MEQTRREDEKRQETNAEKLHEEKVASRRIWNSCPEKFEEYIQRENELHLKYIKQIEEEKQTFTKTVEELKEIEALEHEKRKAVLLQEMELMMAVVSQKCDYVTQTALDNLEGAIEEISKEIRQLKTENSNSHKKQVDERKRKMKEMIYKAHSQRQKNEEEAERARDELHLFVGKKNTELIKARALQARQIGDLEIYIKAAVVEKINEYTMEGMKEVEIKHQELDQMQEELNEQTNIRRKQLKANTESLKNSEEPGHEASDALRKARMTEIDSLNTKNLDINQMIHEARITLEKCLQCLQEYRANENGKIFLNELTK